MKIKIPFLTFILIIGLASFVSVQLCEGIYFTKGASFEIENYSKGQKAGTIKQLVKEVTSAGGKKESLIHLENFDTKNAKTFEGDFKYICEGGKIKIDAQSLMASLKQPGTENIDFKIDNTYLEYPVNPSVGQSLEDMKIVITMSDKNSGQEFGKMKMFFEKRKVEGKQKITTPAGSFDCFKVTAEVRSEITVMGNTRNTPNGKSVDYFNKDVGSVKSEMVDQSGKVESYSILTKYSK